MSGIEVRWHEEYDDIMILTSPSEWSSADMLEAVKKGFEMTDAHASDATYSIVDLTASIRPPSGFITQYMELGKWVHPSTKLTMVMVPSAFMEQLGRIFSRAIFTIRFAHDMDEAIAVVQQYRAEQAERAAGPQPPVE